MFNKRLEERINKLERQVTALSNELDDRTQLWYEDCSPIQRCYNGHDMHNMHSVSATDIIYKILDKLGLELKYSKGTKSTATLEDLQDANV